MPAARTPVSAIRFARRPAGLTRPMKNCLPYCTPTAYRNSARPSVPTIGAGTALGANQPTASATKSTAPTPSEKPLMLISPTR